MTPWISCIYNRGGLNMHARAPSARLVPAVSAALLGFSLLTCTAIEEDETEVAVRFFPLDAYCQVNVRGIGWLDAETDYLPHVVQCENGGADMESLKAQAVAARSYMYYKMETSGSIADGTSDQVYSCGRTPGPEHHAAVEATSGQFLTYMGIVVCAFYVAGADPSNRATCVALAGDSDPTNTERYVTYNEGLTGDSIHQTTLGWVDPDNYRNRGCMSQWGSRCLDERGYGYADILRFYYGADITIETAVGDCVVTPCEPQPEVCNGADDDCDGSIDEDYSPFPCGTGECAATSTCSGGVEECNPLPPPSTDDALCDGRDEDCDGLVDEDCVDPAPDASSDVDGDGGAADSSPDIMPDAPRPDGLIEGWEEGYDGIYEAGLSGGCGCTLAR